MKTFLRPFLIGGLAALTLVASGCNKEKTASGTTGGKASTDLPPDQVLAKIGNESITVAQLDEQIKVPLKQADEQYAKQKFDLRRQSLDNMINERLVKDEAKKRNLTEEQLFKAEVDDKVTPPSEEQVQKMFNDAAGRLPPGSSIETFRPQIVEFLSRGQKQAKVKELVDRLRKDAKVEVLLSEPRKQVEAKGPSRGPNDAKVTVVEFSDFQCPYCGRARDTVEQVMQAYPGKVKLVFRQFPLSMHPNAQKAAEASLCANEQGKFWELHDVMFKNQQELAVDGLKTHAKAVGLDETKFAACLDSNKFEKTVKEDLEAGSGLGVTGTPAFFINGIFLNGAQPLEEFKRIIDQELSRS